MVPSSVMETPQLPVTGGCVTGHECVLGEGTWAWGGPGEWRAIIRDGEESGMGRNKGYTVVERGS